MSVADRPGISRREALIRLGATAGVLTGAGAVGRAVWDQGGFELTQNAGARQVRDYRVGGADPQHLELAVAKAGDEAVLPEELVRRAVNAIGGIKRFVSRGD